MSWSLLSGSPRLGEEPGRPRGLSSDGLAWRARLLALAAALVLAWAGAGSVAFLLEGRVAASSVALFGILPAAGLAVLLFVLSRGERGLALSAGAASATLALVLAIAGHLLHPRGEPLRPLFPPGFGGEAGALGVLLVVLACLVGLPKVGLALRALVMGFDASGSRPPPVRAMLRAASQRTLDDEPRGADVPLGLLRALGLALLLPGFLVLDALATLAARARGPRDRLHADADLDKLAKALQEEGVPTETEGRGLRVRVGSGSVLVQPRSLALPAVEAAVALDVRGDAEDCLLFRRLLEGPLCAHAVFSWSRVGRRVEARLNALLLEAARAATTEERGLLLEETDRLERALDRRRLSEEERTLLVTWKLQRLRGLLVSRMLTEPPGAKDPSRALAPAPALTPPLARVMEAGGLSAMRRAVYVPHWIVPLRTVWGEREVVVNALTSRADAHDAPLLLEAMTARGPSLALEMGKPASFLPAPAPTAALLRELRGLGDGSPGALGAVELVYVPFVPLGEGGYVNVVTGARAPDLGAPLPVSA